MSVKYSPFGNSQILDASGNPAVGWTIGTYTAGSSARLASYTDATGSTAQTADIVLNALGLPTNGQIWLTAGSSYKFIVKNASGVTQFTVDNIAGVNDTSAATGSQWQSSNMTPTFVSTTSFTVPGDQTTELHVGRKAQFTTTAGTVYGKIATTAFAALTTVTMTMDSGQVLDTGLSVVNLSLLRADHSALPGGVNSEITALTGLTNMSAFQATTGTTASASAIATNFTEEFDSFSNFNPTTGTFTAPVAGVYEFAAAGQLPLFANRGMTIFFRVNGTIKNTGADCTELANNALVNIRPTVTGIFNLAANDTVTVSLTLAGYTAGTCDYFWGKRIL